MNQPVGVRILPNRPTLDSHAEAALLEQARRQNYEAFGRIVDAYQSRIMGFVSRMVATSDDAEDVTQEVFIRAFQSLHKFDGRCTIRTWLFRIAHNLCIDASRKRGRAVAEMSLVDRDGEVVHDAADPTESPEAQLLTQELESVLERAVATMSEKLRTVLLLHDREQLGYDELAQILGVPVGTVKSRLFLARAHVGKALEEYRK